MARNRYLIAYDIAEPKRLRSICKLMERNGDRLQHSVFVADLSRGELARLRADAEATMELDEDTVLIVDMGAPSNARFTFIGQHRGLPERSAQIV